MVTGFGVLHYDELGGDPAKTLATLQRNPSDSSGKVVARIKRGAGSLKPQYFWTTDINPDKAVIDNSTYGYHIRANLYINEPTAMLTAFVAYGYDIDPPGGGDVDYSGTWNIVENTYEANCDDLGPTYYFMEISHVGDDVTFYPPEGDPATFQLVGNTVTVDTENGADSFHLTLTFASGDYFEAEFVEYWEGGTCFKKAHMIGYK